MNPSSPTTEQLKIVIVGHVDHGKSTFVGRLFHDTGSLPEGKLEQLQKVSERRGVPFEWANLMDALKLVLACQRELAEKELSPNAVREPIEFVEA